MSMTEQISFDDLLENAGVIYPMRDAYLRSREMGRSLDFLHHWSCGGPGMDPRFRAYLRQFSDSVTRYEGDPVFSAAAQTLLDKVNHDRDSLPSIDKWYWADPEWNDVLMEHYAAAGGDPSINTDAMYVLFQITEPFLQIERIEREHRGIPFSEVY